MVTLITYLSSQNKIVFYSTSPSTVRHKKKNNNKNCKTKIDNIRQQLVLDVNIFEHFPPKLSTEIIYLVYKAPKKSNSWTKISIKYSVIFCTNNADKQCEIKAIFKNTKGKFYKISAGENVYSTIGNFHTKRQIRSIKIGR